MILSVRSWQVGLMFRCEELGWVHRNRRDSCFWDYGWQVPNQSEKEGYLSQGQFPTGRWDKHERNAGAPQDVFTGTDQLLMIQDAVCWAGQSQATSEASLLHRVPKCKQMKSFKSCSQINRNFRQSQKKNSLPFQERHLTRWKFWKLQG
jgi:hypothetical protein